MVIEKLGQMAEIITTMACIHMLYNKKFVLNIQAILAVFIDLIAYELTKMYELTAYSNMMVYISLIVYSIWIFDSTARDLIINIALLIMNTGLLQAIVILPTTYFFTIYGIELDIAMICNMLVLILTFLVNRFIGYKNIKQYVASKKGFNVIIASVFMVNVAYGLFSIRITGTTSVIALAWGTFFCALMSITCYQWLRQKELVREREIDLQMYQLYYDSFQALLWELRARQHDFKNHIQAIHNQHYVCKDYESLVRAQRIYCDEVIKVDRFAGLLSCNNSIIAGFLYGKFVEIEKNGILIKYAVSVFHQNYSIPLYLIIETVGILLDNAMEYILQCDLNCVPPVIEIELYEKTEKMHVKVTNPVEKMSVVELMSYFERGKSTKGADRGIGLAKIKQYSNKYKWEILVDMNEGEINDLIIEIVIPLYRTYDDDSFL